jgi:chromosome segregation ATPase
MGEPHHHIDALKAELAAAREEVKELRTLNQHHVDLIDQIEGDRSILKEEIEELRERCEGFGQALDMIKVLEERLKERPAIPDGVQAVLKAVKEKLGACIRDADHTHCQHRCYDWELCKAYQTLQASQGAGE